MYYISDNTNDNELTLAISETIVLIWQTGNFYLETSVVVENM